MRMNATLLCGGLLMGMLVGCAGKAPPPPRTEAPPRGEGPTRGRDPVRPVMSAEYDVNDGLFDDRPILNQRTPEERAFVEAYNAVGRPKITLFVNRTLEGNLISTVDREPAVAYERTRRATTGVSVENRSERRYDDYWRSDRGERIDRFETTGPGELRETSELYLPPPKFDEVAARMIDYQAIETIMTDWLSASGNVTLMSPTMVRQKLTDEQVKAIESGRPQVLREIAQQLDTDILIQAQARPTRQTPDGMEVRLVVEAFNIRGGESVGRAMVDIPPPLQKTTINRYTRFLARKLMDDMIGTWSALRPMPTTQENAEPARNADEHG